MPRAKNVLVVDDDVEFRQVLGELLRQEGCFVREAENGKVAIRMLDLYTPDLIFVDLMMPVMNGWDFCEALQRDDRLSQVPVAVLSAVARMRPLGSKRVLYKPVDLPNLLGVLEAIDAPAPLSYPNVTEPPMDTLQYILETKAKGKGLVITRPDATALEAVDEMCREHVGALLVADGDKRPVGVVSERDVMTRLVLERRNPENTRVADIMTREVLCVSADTSPENAMAVMTEHHCRHLPVVRNGRIVGLISIGDLVRWATRHQESELQMLTEYMCGKYPG